MSAPRDTGSRSSAPGDGDELPDDVRRRLQRDFAGETWFEATRLLESLSASPRLLRALLVLARGHYPDLERFARCAEQDWREVLFWAEYEDHDAPQPRRVRDLSRALDETEPGR